MLSRAHEPANMEICTCQPGSRCVSGFAVDTCGAPVWKQVRFSRAYARFACVRNGEN